MASTNSNLRKVIVLVAAASVSAAPYNYNYGGAGWGTVGAPDYYSAAPGVCATGTKQSPINVAAATVQALPPLNLAYSSTTDWSFVATVNYMEIGEIEAVGANTTYAGPGNLGTAVSTSANGITMDAFGYTMTGASASGMYVPLSQYHFHTPSENTINGVHYPLEMHMVHKAFSNSSNTSSTMTVATVVSIMFRLSDTDAPSTFLAKLLSGNSQINNTALYTATAANLDGDNSFNLMTDVFSTVGTTAYYAFNGSLTTPPCTEGLNWRVMATPMTMSSAQLAIFRTALALKQGTGNYAQGGDNRNVQPLNARTILATTATIPTISAAPKAVASVAALMAVVAAAIAF